MHAEPMTLAEFERQLDTTGGVLARWAPALAARANALLEVSPTARNLHEHALELDRALDAALTVQTSSTSALRARILGVLERERTQPLTIAAFGFGAGWLRPLVFALVPLCLGFAIGAGYSDGNAINDELITDVSLFTFVAYAEVADAQ